MRARVLVPVVAVFAAGLICSIEAASNSFATAEGEGVVTNGDAGFGVVNPQGPVDVVLTARPGWSFHGGETMTVTHRPGEKNIYPLIGKDGEEDTKVTIEDVWECDHKITNHMEHAQSPVIEIVNYEHALALYAYPEAGARVSLTGGARVKNDCVHVVKYNRLKCPKPDCEWNDWPDPDPDVTTNPPLPIVFSAEIGGIKPGALVPFGRYDVSYHAVHESDNEDCRCSDDKEGVLDVYRTQVLSPDYIGLDRTDAGRQSASKMEEAQAVLDRKLVGTPAYAWTTSERCVSDGNQKGETLRYRAKDADTPSPTYLAETNECTVTISDSHDCRATATPKKGFTIVKVDVQIGEVPNEETEEKEGSFVLFANDYEEKPFTLYGSNNLVSVSFTVEPKDLPGKQKVKLDFAENELFEVIEKNGKLKYEPAAKSYAISQLKEKKFALHGHARSENLRDKNITITHEVSGAIDIAKYTVVELTMAPDYDRDHKIDKKDWKKAAALKKFYWWLNDDADDGDCASCYADEGTELPGSGDLKKNNTDESVNGRADLLDFFPVHVKIGNLLKMLKNEKGYEIRIDPKGAGFVTTELLKDNAGEFLFKDSDSPRRPITIAKKTLCEAKVIIDPEEGFDSGFKEKCAGDPEGAGILIMEARNDNPAVTLALYHDGKKVVESTFPFVFVNVLDMMNLIDLTSGAPKVQEMKITDPDFAPLNVDVFYLHGFKVKSEYAKGWHSEQFKRLHQSGSEARFNGVTWPGYVDAANPGLYYHDRAYHAFKSGKVLAEYVKDRKDVRKKTVVMAHSLGNMVVSSAIQDYDWKPTMYFLLNGAVASEAYDETACKPNGQDEKYLVHSTWREKNDPYPIEAYCSEWYKLFLNDEDAASRSRAKLTWKGRFKDVAKWTACFNFYSSGDEVFEICTDSIFWTGENFKIVFGEPHDLGNWNWLVPSLDLSQFCWHKQEIGKGVKSPFNLMPDSDMAGWGFRGPDISESYNKEKEGRYVSPFIARDIVTNGQSKYFKDLPAFRINPRNVFFEKSEILTQDQVNKMLACAIPAVSKAMGLQPTFAKEANITSIKMEDLCNNGWGRTDYNQRWLHCDLKDMAYFYNYGLSNELVTKGGLKPTK